MTTTTDDVLDPTAAAEAAVSSQPTEALLGVETSLSGRKWRLREADDASVSVIARQLQIPDALARVIAARDIAPDAAAGYMQPRLRDSFPDPSSLADMDLAATTIWDAVEAGRRMALFADYDVDGATSAAQLWRWLKHFGLDAEIYIPDRVEEGYGPSAAAFESLRERGAELVVTLDCGAAAHEALKHGAGIGLDIVVIDHHLMDDDFPPATALVNPNRPDDTSGCGHLAAAGVTFGSQAALDDGIGETLGVDKELLAVSNTRGGITKKSMILNDATPKVEVDPETYEVRADGELLTCEPADVLPMAQRYFLF